MRIVLHVFILSIFGFNLFAQTKVVTNEKGEKVTEIYMNQNSLPVRYKGSILFSDEFETGKFKIDGGQIIEKPVLFNIFEDLLIADFGEKIVSMQKTSFTLGNHEFEYLSNLYLEPIFKSNIIFYERKYCNLKRYSNELPRANNEYAGEVERKTDYFLSFPSGKLRQVSLTTYSVKLAFMREYPDAENLLLNYKMKIKTQTDLVNLLKNTEFLALLE